MTKERNVSLQQIALLLEQQRTKEVMELFQSLLYHVAAQEARLEAVVKTSNDAICIIDEQDRVVVWNEQAEQLYGIQAPEIIGQPLERFFPQSMLSQAMKERRTVDEEYYIPWPQKHVLINARPVAVEGAVIGGACTERDITEVVQLHHKLTQTSQEVQSLKKAIGKIYTEADAFSAIYGHSKGIREAISLARKVAVTTVPVLLRGESGTGKEVFARAIHEASQVRGSFVAINCGAIPATLFESELFGYQAGAFTGADRKGKEGLLEKANGGTLLLDELGDMPKDMQVKLLRTLQDKCFYRVGGNKPIHVDVRIVAATHRNLEEMIARGEFREDLYYRLNVVGISLPPLRERREDLPELAHKGVQYFSAIHNKQIQRLDPALMAAFMQHSWPGNIRELYNVLERLVILADSDTLGMENLPADLLRQEGTAPLLIVRQESTMLAAADNLEREWIVRALEEVGGNKLAAAKKLGIPRSTLYYKLRKYGLDT